MISFILMLNYYPSIITAIGFHNERTTFAYLGLLLQYMTMFGRSALFLLIALPGGMFFSWFISTVAVEDCGAKRKDEINWQYPIKKGIAGFFYPIVGVFMLLPYITILAIVIAIGYTLVSFSFLTQFGMLGMTIVFVYVVVSFIVLNYIVWLSGSLIGCSLSCVLVSLVSYRYLKNEHVTSEQAITLDPSSERLRKQQDMVEYQQKEKEMDYHELLDYVKKGIDPTESDDSES